MAGKWVTLYGDVGLGKTTLTGQLPGVVIAQDGMRKGAAHLKVKTVDVLDEGSFLKLQQMKELPKWLVIDDFSLMVDRWVADRYTREAQRNAEKNWNSKPHLQSLIQALYNEAVMPTLFGLMAKDVNLCVVCHKRTMNEETPDGSREVKCPDLPPTLCEMLVRCSQVVAYVWLPVNGKLTALLHPYADGKQRIVAKRTGNMGGTDRMLGDAFVTWLGKWG